MMISCTLSNTILDCLLTLEDESGIPKKFYLASATGEGNPTAHLNVTGSSFRITLTPQLPDCKPMLAEMQTGKWYDKLAQKAGEALLKVFDSVPLKAACTYRMDGLQDGDCLDISMQSYAFETIDKLDLLELFPVIYLFFEVSHQGRRYAPEASVGTNRKAVINAARIFAGSTAAYDFLFSVLLYPLQISRVKRLTKDRKLQKTLLKFHNMSDQQRQKLLERMEASANAP